MDNAEICILSDEEESLPTHETSLLRPNSSRDKNLEYFNLKNVRYKLGETLPKYVKFPVAKAIIGSVSFTCAEVQFDGSFCKFTANQSATNGRSAVIEICYADIKNILYYKDGINMKVILIVAENFVTKLNRTFAQNIFINYRYLKSGYENIILFFCSKIISEDCVKFLQNEVTLSGRQTTFGEATTIQILLFRRLCGTLFREIKPKLENIDLLQFPNVNSQGKITINLQDLQSLAPMTFLNDTIIDFYLSYIFMNNLTQTQKNSVHIFNTFFYSKVESTFKSTSVDDNQLGRWTKNFKLSDYRYLVIPINQSSHWVVVIVCLESIHSFQTSIDFFPETSSKPHVASKTEKRLPNIVILFDSLGKQDSKDIFLNVQKFLNWSQNKEQTTCASSDQNASNNEFKLKAICPDVPRQTNYYDCGIYLLHYVENFFNTFLKCTNSGTVDWRNWFEVSELSSKRRTIIDIILTLALRS